MSLGPFCDHLWPSWVLSRPFLNNSSNISSKYLWSTSEPSIILVALSVPTHLILSVLSLSLFLHLRNEETETQCLSGLFKMAIDHGGVELLTLTLGHILGTPQLLSRGGGVTIES